MVEQVMELERVGVNAHYVYQGGDAWCVPVHVVGTAGNMARYGFAMTDGDNFWDFEERSYEDCVNFH